MNQSQIRNFAIIAHVDHGKSTLADRFLEITETVPKNDLKEQFLDQNPISRERGITIKLAPVRMIYHPEIRNQKSEIRNNPQIQNSNEQNNFEFRDSNFEFASSRYILNLIDTPGHVDFSYEVSRTLAACDGAILLVDATQGIQAQTVAHFQSAKKLNLKLIPVINKIDLPNAQIETTEKELVDTFGFTKEEMLFISAKTGENVGNLLDAVVGRIPTPHGSQADLFRALIFDAVYDEYKGVVAYVRIMDGIVAKGERIQFFQNGTQTEITDIGHFTPFLKSSGQLLTGEIGYIITGIKDIRLCRVGDTIINSKLKIKNSKLAVDDKGVEIHALSGYKVPKPMVFFGVYPKTTDDLIRLKESLGKLALNDTALTYTEEYSAYLGSGFRVGFLGLLHAEIVKERLKQEFLLDLLFTMPHVLYDKDSMGEYLEPYMKLIIYTPSGFVGSIITLCQKRKGNLIDLSYFEMYAVLTFEAPYSMFMRGLSAELKSVSSGFGSIDYELIEYRKADLVSLEVRINDVSIDVLSELVYRDEAIQIARQKAEKLKEFLERQQFRQIIQSVVNGTIVAREEIPPFRKNVLAKMSGGDRTRKDKLLKKQKRGKAKMITTGKIVLPQEAILSMIENT
ncbi:MAG: elongation factor 4 [Candidatus Levybacteria bacterium RIFCSPHIGHO2_12_FULL_38_12]|nr:MAG: elongation factor 4 [Candidatus Levybacteria bacterium RIFCSPHIGHO2_01_FULL_38_12]OGH22022.1 MAG: elongation factor 4 [Candidatus Levybacteria bacterium RIFCSPHIGHO2_02_FULL_37_18]OGH23260.1 MAG: elongation factor 4 [Candidatus Levybacteria bacterium RIFCSPHIGHO2_12_FULL_38_12]OGH33715.1 MAG: elongation factor 4 [Candidatus Levybacteria bacterium RIFCSPLOWO2_01_FULL_37_20]OGH44621.1 MAG: elongation factor 4 [Candidatus Levybacteria bacterium RIFCSPLOWO2_02_FULL_37_18]OGH52505.1 MAG: el